MRLHNRQPDFENIGLVLEKKPPKRPTLFEFIINWTILQALADRKVDFSDYSDVAQAMVKAFANAGYDFAVLHSTRFAFHTGKHRAEKTISLNEGSVIFDRESFSRYVWNDPKEYSLRHLERAGEAMEDGMKLVICGPCGVLENVIAIVGYETLCTLLYDDEELVGDVFENVGNRLVEYYDQAMGYDFVGAVMCNDDWGFNQQTMLSPAMMRKYVFPFYKTIVENAHRRGKYAMLHSCGRYDQVIGDVIEDMKFDGRHSYEDNIVPVERAYRELKGKLAVLGGIDMDFLARRPIGEIVERCRNMMEMSAEAGGFALGSGNSIPDFISFERFRAMLDVVLKA